MLKKISLIIFIFSIITFLCYGMAVKIWADSDKDASDDAGKKDAEKPSAIGKSGNEATDKISPPVEKLLIGQKESPETKKEQLAPLWPSMPRRNLTVTICSNKKERKLNCQNV